MPLLKNGEWIEDAWRYIADDEKLPATGPKIVTLARLLGDDAEYLFHCGCQLGVRLTSGEKVEDLEPWLPRLGLVALDFPKFADGRAFSSAAILRRRYRFKGEIRATGEVLVDQYQFMRRTGFDSFEVAEGRALESWQKADIEMDVVYQYDDLAPGNGQSRALDVWRARRDARLAVAAE